MTIGHSGESSIRNKAKAISAVSQIRLAQMRRLAWLATHLLLHLSLLLSYVSLEGEPHQLDNHWQSCTLRSQKQQVLQDLPNLLLHPALQLSPREPLHPPLWIALLLLIPSHLPLLLRRLVRRLGPRQESEMRWLFWGNLCLLLWLLELSLLRSRWEVCSTLREECHNSPEKT